MNRRLTGITVFSLSLLICGVYAQSDRRLSDAKQALNHANTYHWLARYKNSDSRDFLESKRWFELAVFLAKDDSSKEANKIRDIATAGIKESNIRYENNFDNIMNDYPLFQVLNGLNNTYELHDDPDAIAASVALENAMTPLVLTPPL